MLNKTNLLAAAVIATAALSAAPAANASIAGGLAASSIATTTATTTTVPAQAQGNIILAHGGFGIGWGHGHWHGGWHGGYGYRGCRWLKRKWRRTGSRYWKKRYFRCINGWY